MALLNGPRIVTSGLVLNLDAADRNSYPGSGTTWNDLSGNNNSTLVNGPTFSSANQGSIVFDGVNDYATQTQLYNYTSSTWSCWFKPSTLTTVGGYARRLMHKSDGIGNQEIDLRHSLGSISYSAWTSNYIWNISGSGITTDNWYNVVAVQEIANVYLYINNQLASSTSYVGSITSTVPLFIGRVGFTSVGHYSGNISAVQIYNRALSAQEVAQNYNATKTRYGL